jgi:hypothetical protein
LLRVVISDTKFFVTVPPMFVASGSAVMVTAAPEPDVVTVKSFALVAVLPATATEIFPVVEPVGTVVVMEVAVLAVTTDVLPLNVTVLLAGVELKFVPVMVTVVPIGPEVGAKEIIVGVAIVVTVKLFALVAVLPATVTEIVPVVAPVGTVVVILVVVLAVTTAVVPLNETELLAGVVLKLVPMMITFVLTWPFVGVKEVMVGLGVTTKFVALCTVIQLLVTEIRPVVAEAGTVVLMLVNVLADTMAVWLLKNLTSLLAETGLKSVPTIATVVPMGPDAGENEVMVGVGIAGPILIFSIKPSPNPL